MSRKSLAVVFIVFFVCVVAYAAIAATPAFAMDRAHFRELNKRGREVANKKDWPALREVLIEIGNEMPGLTPTFALRMASVETRLGHIPAALQWMDRYVAMGLTYDLASDDDLKPLLAEPGWKIIAAQMERNAAPIMHAEHVCNLPIADLMPEDLTFDKLSQAFIVSSIQHHSLYRVSLPKGKTPDCAVQELPLEPEAKRWPMMAVSFDPARKLVWMTSAAIAGFTGITKEDAGKSALLAIDPRSGKTVVRLEAENTAPVILGDMSVSANGTVYVTDSLGGGVYRVQGMPEKAGADSPALNFADLKKATLEKIADGLYSPQTPVLAADGRRLFVPEYSLGVAVIDLGSGKVTELTHLDNVAVTGLDGMHLVGDSLIGIQNGTEPARIIRFRLNHSQTAIESAEVIEQSTSRLGEPTHAIAVDGWFYVTANVGWDKVDDHGNLKPGATITPPVLLRFPIKEAGSLVEKVAPAKSK